MLFLAGLIFLCAGFNSSEASSQRIEHTKRTLFKTSAVYECSKKIQFKQKIIGKFFFKFIKYYQAAILNKTLSTDKLNTCNKIWIKISKPNLRYGRAHFNKCKQLFEDQHVILLRHIWWSKFYSIFKCGQWKSKIKLVSFPQNEALSLTRWQYQSQV